MNKFKPNDWIVRIEVGYLEPKMIKGKSYQVLLHDELNDVISLIGIPDILYFGYRFRYEIEQEKNHRMFLNKLESLINE